MQATKKAVFLFIKINLLCIVFSAQALEITHYRYSAPELFAIGSVLLHQGAYQEAVKYLELAVTAAPENASYHWTLGDAYLFLEKIEEGMPHFAYRWKFDSQFKNKTIWNGEAVTGKTLLVQHQWDLRNTLLCLRYLKILKHQGATIVMRAPTQQHSLLQLCPFIDEVVATEQPAPTHDFIIPILHLPTVFQTNKTTIPSTEGCIVAAPSTKKEKKIAISITNETIARLIDPSQLSSLKQIITRIQLPEQKTVVWAGSPLMLTVSKDYAEFATVCSQLNYFVTDSTVAAQIAGILGIPTLLLLENNTDWFWQTNETFSSWFPSVKIMKVEVFNSEFIQNLLFHLLETVSQCT